MLAVTLASLLLCGAAVAQEPANQQEGDTPVFRSGVNLVNLFFTVKDKRGGLVPGLTKDDFQVFEDGKPQTIRYFSAETNQPLTLGMLVDTSGSMAGVLPAEKELGSAFLREVLREKDLAFLINFDVNVELLQDFTSSSKELRDALHSARINTGGGTSGGVPGLGGGPIPPSAQRPRGTLLYDAVFLAADEKLARETGRKALVVLSDGVDQGSKMNLKDAIEAAHRAEAIVYVILVAESGVYGQYVGDGEMKKLANETGGRMIEIRSDDQEKLKQAFDQISSELRNQYTLAYSPSNKDLDGSFRKVQIKPVKKDMKVQSRAGYYAVKQN